MLLGILCQKTYECLIFLLFHIPLRVYAGGFHQNTRERCYALKLDEKSFEELAAELGLGYKGAAVIYYRAIQKIKNRMKEAEK